MPDYMQPGDRINPQLTRQLLLFGIGLFFALSTDAKVMAIVEYQGKELTEAEICFYPIIPGKPLSNQLERHYRCYPSGTVLEIPDRIFSVFARHDQKLITANQPMVYGSSEPKLGIVTLRLNVVPTASLAISIDKIRPEEELAVLIGETAENRPALMPLDPEQPVIPGASPIVPLLIRHGSPVVAGPLVHPKPGEVHAVQFKRSTGRVVLVTFEAEDENLEADEQVSGCKFPYSATFLRRVSTMEPPVVELIDSRGTIHQSELKAVNASNLFESVYIFRDPAPGQAMLRVSGRHWSHALLPVSVADAPVTIAPPIRLEPGGALTLSTYLPTRSLPPDAQCGSDSLNLPGQPRAILYDCGDGGHEPLSKSLLDQCTPSTSRSLGDERGDIEVTFQGLLPKPYVIATALGERIVNFQSADITVGETLELEMDFARMYMSGRVSHHGMPLGARVQFRTGSAVADPMTGEYYAPLSSAPGTAPVYVVSCDESLVYMHNPEMDLRPGPGFDLVIPANQVQVEVVDSSTKRRLKDATVALLRVDADDPTRGLGGMPASAAEDDLYRSGRIEPGSRVLACAEKQGYRRTCSEYLTIKNELEKLRIALPPLGKAGRVRPAGGYTTAVWVRPDGEITEMVPIDDEGNFYYGADSHMNHLILVGATAPLWVIPPATAIAVDDVLELDAPVSTERSVTFRLEDRSATRTATILLWINGLPVPQDVLLLHQQRRRQPWRIVEGRPVTVRGLMASDLIAAAEGPHPDLLQGVQQRDAAAFAGRQMQPVLESEFVFP